MTRLPYRPQYVEEIGATSSYSGKIGRSNSYEGRGSHFDTEIRQTRQVEKLESVREETYKRGQNRRSICLLPSSHDRG